MALIKYKYGKKFWLGFLGFIALGLVCFSVTYDVKSILNEGRMYLAENLGLSKAQGYLPRDFLSFFARLPVKALEGAYPPALPEVNLHIKQKHFDVIEQDRNTAIERGLLYEPRFVPLKLQSGDDFIKSKVRLKGDLANHWSSGNRWSFRVKLKGGNFIENAREFSLQKPISRQFPADYYFQAFVRELGNLGPETSFLRTFVNGEDWGVLLLEEHVDKYMLEKQQRKESVLFRMNNQTGWAYRILNKARNQEISSSLNAAYGLPVFDFYGEKKIGVSETSTKYASYVVANVREVLYGRKKASGVFDVESFSKAYLAAVLWNDPHTLHSSNARYYLNPYSLKVEIVTTDAGFPKPFNPLGEKSPLNPKVIVEKSYPVYARLLADEAFHAAVLKNSALLPSALDAVSQHSGYLQSVFPLENVNQSFSFDLLGNNLKQINAWLPNILYGLKNKYRTSLRALSREMVAPSEPVVPEQSFVPELFYAEYSRQGQLDVYNYMPSPLIVDQIVHKGAHGEKQLLERPIEIPSGSDGVLPNSRRISLPKLSVNPEAPLQIYAHSDNFSAQEEVVMSFDREDGDFYDFFRSDDLNKAFKAFVTRKDGGYYVSQGRWRVTSPIIIPPGSFLNIEPGTELVFDPDAYILSLGSLQFSGSEHQPIVLRSDETSWKGLYVLNADSPSYLQHTVVSDTTFFEAGPVALTGGVNFYHSPVVMDHVVFDGSRAEDALNIVHSDFELVNVVFKASRSDAFDADFSTGVVNDCSFIDVGGDALDTSGSSLSVKNLSAKRVKDKAVSAGEGSTLDLANISVLDSAVAVAVKDGSNVTLKGLGFSNIGLAPVMVYSKKPFYGAASAHINAEGLEMNDIALQRGNVAVLNNQQVSAQNLDVDELYSVGPMKKIK
ncbi:MAG: CotH kinase family protein [Desulfuromonadales bacterium]|nr:CotH kinase family protein [Desulfuromonadales bacterium]